VKVLLDGPMGAQLEAQGVDLSAPLWSARALQTAPQAIAALHRAYADAGAQVHRTNSFRTTARVVGDGWQALARLSVQLAREAGSGRVAGSLGPLEDCYRPELAPAHDVAREEHAALAHVLVDAGVDLLLCETFPSPDEALAAVQACVSTGAETWVSFTAGPDATLLSPQQVFDAAVSCVAAGARSVLVNCIAAERTLPFVDALRAAGVPFGAYANAGTWNGTPVSPLRYAELAGQWRRAGASLIGGCCGTTVDYLKLLR
jgi:S-methylmethionine-dependent homocysteine/selenocysteine methylase